MYYENSTLEINLKSWFVLTRVHSFIFQFLAHCSVVLVTCQVMYTSSSCQDLTNWRIRQKLGYDPRESDVSFNIIPQFYKSRKAALKKSEENGIQRKEQFTRLYGNSTCPSELDTGAYHVMFRSSCPWYVELSVDKTRIPVTMAKARCRCKDCQMKTRPHPDFSCVPVNTYRKVLREIPNQCDSRGYKMYITRLEEVPVACTCVAARVM